MKEDGNINAYFQHVDEKTNTLEGLGDPLDENTIIPKCYTIFWSSNLLLLDGPK